MKSAPLFPSLPALRAANAAGGWHFFEPAKMRAFRSRLVSGLIGGRYAALMTADLYTLPRYRVLYADARELGRVHFAGPDFDTAEAARDFARRLALGEALAGVRIPEEYGAERTARGLSVEARELSAYLQTSAPDAERPAACARASMARIIARGSFDAARFPDAWRGTVEAAAAQYAREHGGYTFRPEARRLALLDCAEAAAAEFNVNRWGLSADYLAHIPGAVLAGEGVTL